MDKISDLGRKVDFEAGAAASYDQRIQQLVPGYDVMQQLSLTCLRQRLPKQASILVVGAGTGAELELLAMARPAWKLLALEPSKAMLTQAKKRIENAGLSEQLRFEQMTLQQFCQNSNERFDAVLALLVGHFLPDNGDRQEFFLQLGRGLKVGAPLLFADLCQVEIDAAGDLQTWMQWRGSSLQQCQHTQQRMEDNFYPLRHERLQQLLLRAELSKPHCYWQSLAFKAFISYKSPN